MQAILIATGEENKLHPLTTTMPSPMIPIVDRPVMVYAIELLARAGIRDIFVSLYEPADCVQRYFGNGERWNVRLHYLLQQNVGNTTSILKEAAALLTETFVVLPADAMIDLDIQTALRFHQAHGGIATAILSDDAEIKPARSSFATIDTDGRLQPVAAKGVDSAKYIQTGAFIFETTVFDAITTPTSAADQSLLTMLFQAETAVYGYLLDGYWNPLDTFSDFQAAQSVYLASLTKTAQTQQAPTIRYPYVEAGEVQPGIWIGPNSIIHPGVRLTAPLFIGAGCRIGPDVELGPATVIGAGVVLDEGVTVQQSTVLSHTYVGQFLHLAQRVAYHAELIDVATGVNVQIADPWLLSMVNPTLPGDFIRASTERVLAWLTLGLFAPFLTLLSMATWLSTSRPTLMDGQALEHTPTGQLRRQWAMHRAPLAWLGWPPNAPLGGQDNHRQHTLQQVQPQAAPLRYPERENQPLITLTFNE